MDYDYKKRDYLLPEGCKDLINVLKLNDQPVQPRPAMTPATPLPLPPIAWEIKVAEQMTVYDLATVLKQKPFLIIADLIEFGVFATVHQQIGFETIAKVVQKYGYTAKRVV